MAQTPPIVAETVDELLSAVQGLVRDESERATVLDTRASVLTGVVGIVLSVAAAAGVATGKGAGVGLDHGVRVLVGALVALALAVLVTAVVVVVVKVLVPGHGVTIALSEVKRYPTYEFISQERVMISAVRRERSRTWRGT